MRRLLAALALLCLAPAALAQDDSCGPSDLAALDGWQGVWLAEGQDTDISGRGAVRATHFFGVDAPWNEAGWERMRANFALMRSGNFAQGGFGYPAMMDNFSELSIFIGLRQTLIINSYRETRIVHTDGRGHIPDDLAFPSTWGDAIGCWHGDTLMIETANVRFDRQYNPAAAPLSDAARFSERLRLVAPGRLSVQMTITDPELLTEPWTVETTLLRYDSADRLLVDGTVNDRSLVGGDSPTIAALTDEGEPGADASLVLTMTELARLVGRYQIEGAPEGTHVIVEARGSILFVAVPGQQALALPTFPQSALIHEGLFGQMFTFATGTRDEVTGLTILLPDGTQVQAAKVN